MQDAGIKEKNTQQVVKLKERHAGMTGTGNKTWFVPSLYSYGKVRPRNEVNFRHSIMGTVYLDAILIL